MTDEDRYCSVAEQYTKKEEAPKEEPQPKQKTMSDRQESTIQLIWLGQDIYFQSTQQLPPESQKRSCRSDRK